MNKNFNLQKVLAKFKPYTGFSVEQYYGVSVLRLKKNDKFSIKLVYDFVNGNAKTSNAFIVDDLDTAYSLAQFLETNRINTFVDAVEDDGDIYDEESNSEGW